MWTGAELRLFSTVFFKCFLKLFVWRWTVVGWWKVKSVCCIPSSPKCPLHNWSIWGFSPSNYSAFLHRVDDDERKVVAAAQVPPAQLVNLRRAAISDGKSRPQVQLSYCPPPTFTTPSNSHPDDHHPSIPSYSSYSTSLNPINTHTETHIQTQTDHKHTTNT